MRCLFQREKSGLVSFTIILLVSWRPFSGLKNVTWLQLSIPVLEQTAVSSAWNCRVNPFTFQGCQPLPWVFTLHLHVVCQEVHLESHLFAKQWTRFPTGLTEATVRKQKLQLVPYTDVILSLFFYLYLFPVNLLVFSPSLDPIVL